jgi:hypothetical protein
LFDRAPVFDSPAMSVVETRRFLGSSMLTNSS